ncbi:response regulator [Gynuella sp.]|uniref:response regulator n=1 Tax=Gynuella sp. TaxID=2969146 RepID=UPI003D116C0E
MIRILVADDQAIVRDGLKLILSLEADFEVVATAEDGIRAVELADLHRPDLILMDIHMPRLDGIAATARILENHVDLRVLMLTTYDTDEWLSQALAAGASGYLLKDTTREDLIKAIRGTLDGKHYLDPQIAGLLFKNDTACRPPAPPWLSELNERELAVLKLIGQGLSNPRIATRLHLSEGTVRNYVSTVLNKLEVTDRTQAAILAVKHGLDR